MEAVHKLFLFSSMSTSKRACLSEAACLFVSADNSGKWADSVWTRTKSASGHWRSSSGLSKVYEPTHYITFVPLCALLLVRIRIR